MFSLSYSKVQHFVTLISGFHHAFLKSITFIGQVMHSIV